MNFRVVVNKGQILALCWCIFIFHSISAEAQVPQSGASTLFYLPQHFLYFFPLPQGQGSLRPICIAKFGDGGFNRRSISEISSGLSGSRPMINFKPRSLHRVAISLSLSSVCTCPITVFLSELCFGILLSRICIYWRLGRLPSPF